MYMAEKKTDETQEIKKPEVKEPEVKEPEVKEPEVKEDESKKKTFRKEPEVDEPKEPEQSTETLEVTVDQETAFGLKLQEFDKNISIAEHQVAQLKMQKASFIYDSNLSLITEKHKADLLRAQIEEETLKRTQDKDKV